MWCASGSGREIRRETMRLSLAGSGPPPSSTRAGPGDEPHMSSGGGGGGNTTTNDKKRPGSSQSQRGSLNDKPGEGVSNARRRRTVEGRQAGRQAGKKGGAGLRWTEVVVPALVIDVIRS